MGLTRPGIEKPPDPKQLISFHGPERMLRAPLAEGITIGPRMGTSSECVPLSTGKMLKLSGPAPGGSAAPLTASLWKYVGLWAVCVVGAASFVLAAGLAWRFLQERQTEFTSPARPEVA